MNLLPKILVLIIFTFINLGFSKANIRKILIFSKTSGFRHENISVGKNALLSLGNKYNLKVDTSENAMIFDDSTLKNYSAIIFFNTSGDILNAAQQTALERYLQAGGGFVGIHCAAACEDDWEWYRRMIGGDFVNHPKVQEATILVTDSKHKATKNLPKAWKRKDEWYNFTNISTDIKVLATIDENSYQGGESGDFHPIIWCHAYDGGRVFYTAGGHTAESFSEKLFLQHLIGGIKYAIGNNSRDYSKSRSY